MMIKVLLAIAGSTAVVCAQAAWANTYVLGGTGQMGAPTQEQMAFLINDKIVEPDTMVGIDYPAQLSPVVGTLSLDKSVREGTDSLEEILQGASGKTTIVGISQGAVVINYAKRRASASGPTDKITFVTLGDPTNADGGLLAKLPPVHIPVLDFTITPPPVATPHDTIEVVREFDGFADAPDRPFNMAANLNALAGTIYVHPNYGGLDLKDEDNVVTYSKNSLGGTTTHILVKTDDLPLTEPLRAIGLDDNVVEAIDKPLRRIITHAYDGPRPGESAKTQPLNNIRVKPSENRSGLNGIRSSLNQVRSNVRQLGQNRSLQRQQRLAQNEQPSAASNVEEGDELTSARKPTSRPESTPGDLTPIERVEPADCVKPVELIELLQRRTAKHKQIEAPTSSPFYDAEFVAKHRTRNNGKSD